MAAVNKSGQPIVVGDSVSIIAQVVSITSGAGGLAKIVVQSILGDTFTAQANDMQSTERSNTATHIATSISGKDFGVAGDPVTVLGVVTAITNPTAGSSAQLSVLLKTSGNTITCSAGACYSAT